MLAGTSGAYCQQRICIAEPSGEICDVPVVPADVPKIDPYAALLQPPRSDEERLVSARDAATVMDVVDAARESSRKGEVIRLDETDQHSL
jgi:predicted dehydrogenase